MYMIHNDIEVSVVMPCLNEAETIEQCIVEATECLSILNVSFEIVIGDNGSTDGSIEIAESLGARVVPVLTRGYGEALYHATCSSKGHYIIMGDSDASYDFSSLEPFIVALRAGNDLVMGNRFRGTIERGAMPWKNRYIGNPVLSGIGRLFFGSNARDFHCGIRGFSRTAFMEWNLQTSGMEYASEMVIKATLLNHTIAEVPTTLRPDGRMGRAPHLRPWRDGWRHLRFMLLYSPRWLFLYPGMLLFLLSLALTVRLIAGPLFLGSVMLDVHTLLVSSTLQTAGFQVVLFSIMSAIYVRENHLRPAEPFYRRIFDFVSLETGLVISIFLFVTGTAGMLWAFYKWQQLGFGSLDPRHMLRILVPSLLAISMGIQIFFSSFLLSMLGLRQQFRSARSSTISYSMPACSRRTA